MTKLERTLADVVRTIEAGEFYQDYDQSSSDLGILRAALTTEPSAPVAVKDADYELAETVHGEIVRIRPSTSMKEPITPAERPAGGCGVEITPADEAQMALCQLAWIEEGGREHAHRIEIIRRALTRLATRPSPALLAGDVEITTAMIDAGIVAAQAHLEINADYEAPFISFVSIENAVCAVLSAALRNDGGSE